MSLLVADSERGRIKIVVTADPAADAATVFRKHPSGEIWTVRGADKARLSGGTLILWDYEAPIGVELEYYVTIWADPTVELGSSASVFIRWDSEQDWLKDPLEPSRNMPINIVDPGDESFDTPAAFHTVLSRPAPLGIGEVRRAATGDALEILTVTAEQRAMLHRLTASGNVLLWQGSQESEVGNTYLMLRGMKKARPGRLRTDPERVWTLSYQEVLPPLGDIGAVVTVTDVALLYPTGQDLIDAGFTSGADFIEQVGELTSSAPIVTWRGA